MDIKLMLQNQLAIMQAISKVVGKGSDLDQQIALTAKRLETWNEDPEGLRFFGEVPL